MTEEIIVFLFECIEVFSVIHTYEVISAYLSYFFPICTHSDYTDVNVKNVFVQKIYVSAKLYTNTNTTLDSCR